MSACLCFHRYVGTVSSNIFVFLVTWVLISTEDDGSTKLTPSDSTAFMVSVHNNSYILIHVNSGTIDLLNS